MHAVREFIEVSVAIQPFDVYVCPELLCVYCVLNVCM